MFFSRVFPRVLVGCLALGLCAASASGQAETRTRRSLTSVDVLEPASIEPAMPARPAPSQLTRPTAIVRERVPVAPSAAASPATQVERLMLAAIGGRLGVPYRMGATGPNRYDCSGFVWSVFQDAGVVFERGSARTLWHRFAAPAEDEKFKFGTLVFFNHLNHVGIVADERGFYHASSSQGIMYSPFSEYWTRRISGFRRVPLQATAAAPLAAAAASAVKTTR